MKKIILTICGAVFTCSMMYAQSNKLDKKMEKAYNLVSKGKITEADEYMVKLLAENPEYGAGWDYLCKIRYKEYSDSKLTDNIFSGTVTVTTKDENGKEVKKENDSLGNSLLEMLSKIKPSETAYDKFKYTMRKATLVSSDAQYCSALLRSYFIDVEIDTAIDKKALKYYDNAEEEFAKKNYNGAAKQYKRALEVEPNFYKASLYLGDCYYFTGNYIDAIASFKSAAEKFPGLLEPRKYLIDAYNKQHLYSEALDACIDAMMVYPDQSVAFARLDDAAYTNEKKLNYKWTPRGVFPNRIDPDSAKKVFNKYTPPAEVMEDNNPWKFYVNAFTPIVQYCNEKGIIVKTNPLTKTKYLELYSWEEMLKNSNAPELEEARKMQKDGYLDCYVMITCFHYDFYNQYVDFVANNRSRIKAYYQKYIVAK